MTQQDLLQQLSDHKYAIDQAAIVAITDPKGVITYVNDKFCEVSGYPRAELIGTTHSLLNSGYHGAQYFREMWKAIRSGKVWKGEIRNRRKDGTLYWVDTTIVPFHDHTGAISQFLSIRHDITALKEAESVILQQQARLAVASKYSGLGEMAANLTHEINNPLATILGRCEMLMTQIEKPVLDKDYILRMIESIEVTARRIEKIIKSMRAFSIAGEGDPFEIVSLNAVVDETIEFVQQRFKDHGIELRVLKPQEDLLLECRSTEISQVLLNLLNNAFDAISTRSEKWVELEFFNRNEASMLMQITDSGTGISDEVVARIFDPFFSTKEKQYGTGLGLSISKGLIERHGGIIEVDLQSPNTRFLITLPLRQRKKPQR